MNITRYATIAARIVAGSAFFIFGLNGFVQFMPTPEMTGDAATFMGGLAAAGYMFPLIKGTEVVAGALLLSGRLVPLALTILAPIVVNIVAFHIFLAPAGAAPPLLLAAMLGYLAWTYRRSFRGVVAVDAAPVGADEQPGVASLSAS